MREVNKNEDKWVAWLTGESTDKPEPEILEGTCFSELKQTWELTGTAYSYRESDPDKVWSELKEKIQRETKIVQLRRFNILKYAAIFVALIALTSITFLLVRNTDKTDNQLVASGPVMKTIQTIAKPLSYTTIKLPDGSTVKLNAGTSLKYPEKFAGTMRKVILSGEAFFNIIHDSNHPFVVEINNVEIEDLGTSFNISAYPGKDQVVVNVVTGSVRLFDKDQKESKIIAAGFSGKFLNKKGEIIVSKELTPNFLSWITRELSFHHTPLSTVFEELENIYQVKLEFSDPGIANIAYTANFEKLQIDDIVNVIAKTHHLSVQKTNDGYVFATR
jgi:ferric-dicitrate binding protein FerR (iron transport regulator)